MADMMFGELRMDQLSLLEQNKKTGNDWVALFNPKVKRVLDVSLIHTMGHDSVVCCVCFSPDGKMLATGCNCFASLYDTSSGSKIGSLIDESGSKSNNYIRAISFSPDGRLLATGSEDGILRIWDWRGGRLVRVFKGHPSAIYTLAFSPDGQFLVTAGDSSALLWNIESGQQVHTFIDDFIHEDDVPPSENSSQDQPVGVTSVIISPDGKWLAAGNLDTVIRVWDLRTGKILGRLRGHEDSVYSVTFARNGQFLISGSLDYMLKVWDLEPLRMRDPSEPPEEVSCKNTLSGHKDFVLSVVTTSDGAWIVSGSKDRAVQFWDLETGLGQFRLQAHKNSVISVAVSETGGYFATGGGDWEARIWSYSNYK